MNAVFYILCAVLFVAFMFCVYLMGVRRGYDKRNEEFDNTYTDLQLIVDEQSDPPEIYINFVDEDHMKAAISKSHVLCKVIKVTR
jgi:hypothetical protein